MVMLLRHRQTKGPGSARLHLNRRATPRLHLIENFRPAVYLSFAIQAVALVVKVAPHCGHFTWPKVGR